MAFPNVGQKGTTYAASTGTTHNVDLPDTISSGDLLLLMAAKDTTGAFTAPTTPAFTEMYQGNTGSTARGGAFYRIADGTESGTCNLVTSTSTEVVATCWRIDASTWFGTASGIQWATYASGASGAAANPPALNPSWGTLDILWIATCDVNNGITSCSFPTNYTGNQIFQDNGTAAIGGAWSSRNLNTDIEDPGTYGNSPTGAWGANTIAIRPAAAVVVFPPAPTIVKIAVDRSYTY